MKSIILFDIDGTIADNSHRQHYLLPPVVDIGDTKSLGSVGCFQCAADLGSPHHPSCPYLDNWQKDWSAFFAEQSNDQPIYEMRTLWTILGIGIAGSHHANPFKRALITGRPENFRAETENWLERHSFRYYDRLIMRPVGDQTDDHILKLKQVEAIYGLDKILCVFEDRTRIVEAWRAAGVLCLQVAAGNF